MRHHTLARAQALHPSRSAPRRAVADHSVRFSTPQQHNSGFDQNSIDSSMRGGLGGLSQSGWGPTGNAMFAGPMASSSSVMYNSSMSVAHALRAAFVLLEAFHHPAAPTASLAPSASAGDVLLVADDPRRPVCAPLSCACRCRCPSPPLGLPAVALPRTPAPRPAAPRPAAPRPAGQVLSAARSPRNGRRRHVSSSNGFRATDGGDGGAGEEEAHGLASTSCQPNRACAF